MTSNNQRAIPADWPFETTLTIHTEEFYDRNLGDFRPQWQAHYLPPGCNHPHDFITVVVNFGRYQYPSEGERWQVEFQNLAPKARLVFARALRRIS